MFLNFQPVNITRQTAPAGRNPAVSSTDERPSFSSKTAWFIHQFHCSVSGLVPGTTGGASAGFASGAVQADCLQAGAGFCCFFWSHRPSTEVQIVRLYLEIRYKFFSLICFIVHIKRCYDIINENTTNAFCFINKESSKFTINKSSGNLILFLDQFECSNAADGTANRCFDPVGMQLNKIQCQFHSGFSRHPCNKHWEFIALQNICPHHDLRISSATGDWKPVPHPRSFPLVTNLPNRFIV